MDAKKDNQLIIRKASSADVDMLLRFEQGVIEAERPFDSTLKTGHIHYYDIEQMIAASYIEIVVAELNHEIIGSGYARIENSKHYLKHQNHAYLGFMYVEPDHRGKGVNKKIIEALKHWAISQNVTEMRLDVYYNNLTAIKAYEKIGFIKHMVEMRMSLYP
ncbi:MAG: GNAT family N-acetyltransferase [Ginsengibacter sp.]